MTGPFHLPPENVVVVLLDIAENVGHVMTYKILDDETHKVVYHSLLCSALDPTAPNLHADLDPVETEDPVPIIQTCWDYDSTGEPPTLGDLDNAPHVIPPDDDDNPGQSINNRVPIVDPSPLIRCTFLKDLDNGQKH